MLEFIWLFWGSERSGFHCPLGFDQLGDYSGHDPEHFEFSDTVPEDEIGMGGVHG